MANKFTDEDDALLEELGVEIEMKPNASHTSREERIIAGFEEIQRFVDEQGRLPQHGEDRDIFERLYATRLDQIRRQEECRAVLAGFDRQGLLDSSFVEAETTLNNMDDEALLAELGVDMNAPDDDITKLSHVRSSADKRAAEEIANREKCEDFDKFKPLFAAVQNDLNTGVRKTRPFEHKSEIQVGNWFIVGGQKAYVAEMGEVFLTAQGMSDARLRVIYDNGTESNMLMRSLQRALHKDEAGRRITNPSAGPLFSGLPEEEDMASGTIYVLRSKSDHPLVSKHRDVVHKIGVTGGDVKRRIANAELDPTFLLAGVEIVATYELFNINRTKLENLIHRVFEPARLEIEIKDRFGRPVVPREWFLVPLFVIDDAVNKIKDGSISNFTYDPEDARLVRHAEKSGGQS